MKLVSKYNKSTISKGETADANLIAEVFAAELNRVVEINDRFNLVHHEVAEFKAVSGFINVFLQND